jgi:ATP-dependent Lon protease
MDNVAHPNPLVEQLRQKINAAGLPQNVSEKLLNQLRFPGEGAEFEKLISYNEFVLSLPFSKFSQDILDLTRAKQILEKNHYGLGTVKDRVLEYLSVLTLHSKNPNSPGFHAPILLFVGLVGTGKTTIAYSIAESLGRPIIRIPFGGLGDPAQLRGISRIRPEAEPGQIMKAMRSAKVNNPVILLDEIDRVAEEGRVNIMGVLVELLDPQQNHAFVDHYLDFPFDLSKVMFIGTANNTANLATAVMDRLEPIQMPAYTDQEKMVIAKNYLLPKALAEAGLDPKILSFDDTIWAQVIRPLGFDAGIRSLSRTLQGLARKIAYQVVTGNPGPYKITAQNVAEYLPS